MDMFGGSKSKQLEFLEDERKKLWARVTALEGKSDHLEKEISHRSSDSEKEARQHSKKTAEFRNKAEARLEEAEAILNALNQELQKATSTKNEINELKTEALQIKIKTEESKSRLDDLEADFEQELQLIDTRIRSVNSIFEKYPDLDEKLEELEGLFESTEENYKKSEVSLTSVNKRKKEIDDLYREIFGYTEEDQNGEAIKVEGLKQELENSYNKLSEDLDKSQNTLVDVTNEYKSSYESFEKNYRSKYQKILGDIESLLPNALTAGLSAAFASKKSEEVESSKSFQRRFSLGIYFLIGVSLIPVAISIYFLSTGVSLEDVINRLPRLVLAIVPMYIPVLWFTYSANKKLNLSKRLIEEYAHKEVLSRTYEGLSKQISNVEDKIHSEELKIRLLSNFLQVSSENPGKLISNYEASDHPVMEALEQSYKFQLAIDKLEGIPGMAKVAGVFEKRAKRKLAEKADKINAALGSENDEDPEGD